MWDEWARELEAVKKKKIWRQAWFWLSVFFKCLAPFLCLSFQMEVVLISWVAVPLWSILLPLVPATSQVHCFSGDLRHFWCFRAAGGGGLCTFAVPFPRADGDTSQHTGTKCLGKPKDCSADPSLNVCTSRSCHSPLLLKHTE